jgi:hypothetical protein
MTVVKQKTAKCVNNTYQTSLTLGKEYEIVYEKENKYYVLNDKGNVTTYYKSRFK